MSTAWIYAVVSSAPQEETLDDQVACGQKTAAENGWTVSRVFSAVTSGKRGVRKALAQLVTELRATPKAERPQRVWMNRLDRVGRGSIIDSMIILREMEQLGVTIHTRERGDESADGPDGEMVRAVRLSLARFENAVRAQKSLDFHAGKRARGEFSGIPAFGFTTLDKHLVPYEPEAALVRDLYDLRLRGWGVHRLSRYAAQRAPAKTLVDGSKRPLKWSPSTISRMMTNRSYRGTVIEALQWDAAVGLRMEGPERHGKRWPWPLRGAVRCTCGLLLATVCSGRDQTETRKSTRTRYYVCHSGLSRHGRYHFHRAERMEAQFVELLRRLDTDTAALLPARTLPLEQMRRRRGDLVRERSALDARRTKAWELAEESLITGDELKARLEELRAATDVVSESLRTLERDLAGAESRTRMVRSLSEALHGAADVWWSLEVPAQRDLARAVAAYVGGLWADPKQPGILLLSSDLPDDARQRACENMREVDTLRNVDMAQRKNEVIRRLATCERMYVPRETTVGSLVQLARDLAARSG